jgi:SET domain-containing protein
MEKAIYSVQLIEGMGRGVIAERDIKLGEIITNCELLLLSPEDTIKVNETDLQWYTFTFDKNSKQDCLVLGDGEIFNHDDNANVLYGLIDWNGRKLMRFQASRDINKGEQLFIDYRVDVDNVDNVLESYTINLI